MKSIALFLALVPLSMHFSSCKSGKKSGALGAKEKNIGPQFEMEKPEAVKLREEQVSKFINERVLTLTSGVTLPTYSFDLTAGLSLGLQYKYGVEKIQDPQSGQLRGARFDTLTFKNNIQPTLIPGIPLGFESNQSIIYARLFDNTAQAAAANPLGAAQMLSLPLTAEGALSIPEGNVISYPVNAQIVLQAPDFISKALPSLPASIRPGIILGGVHKFTVTRLPKNSVRVRIISESLAAGSIGFQAGVTQNFAFSKHLSKVVTFDAKIFQGKKLDAEYEVDLSTPAAIEAYNRALSGKVRITNAVALGGTEQLSKNPLFEVQALENLANADSKQFDSPVTRKRMEFIAYQGAAKKYGISVPFITWGLEKMHTHSNLILQDGVAPVQNVKLSMQKFSRIRQLFGLKTDGDVWASGLVTPSQSTSPTQVPAYWQIWRRHYSSNAEDQSRTTLTLLKNMLGPLVFADINANQELGRLYMGESWIYFPSELMQSLADPRQATAINFWTAAENMVKNFDNKFGLPYNAAPAGALPDYGSPAANARAESACNTVRANWGAYYCRTFGHELIPELLLLQKGASYEQWVAVFEKYGRANFGINYMGSILVARFLSEYFKITNPNFQTLAAFNANFHFMNATNQVLLGVKPTLLFTQGEFGQGSLVLDMMSSFL